MKFAGYYGVVVGTLMLAQWAFFLAAGQVPEVVTAPYQIAFHLAGEAVTAVGLIISGAAVLRRAAWGKSLFLVAAGMVVYSEIVSPGYFAQQGQWLLVAMFMVLLGGALASIVLMLKDRS